MKRLLVLLVFAPLALTAQENPNYDPDYDGDGCYSVNDILGLLPLFGTCDPFLCGDSVLFDGYYYETVPIGDQCWFAENLRTTAYADGTIIPEVTDGPTWSALTTGARCDYDNDATNVLIFGRLYNWYAVSDDRGLCPTGWHVPTDGEWIAMEMELGMTSIEANSISWRGTIEGALLKSELFWWGLGNDQFGFSALPGGMRGCMFDYDFTWAYGTGYWWTSSPFGINGWFRYLHDDHSDIWRSDFNARCGFSVRCLKDAE